jgi:hypothetical protein
VTSVQLNAEAIIVEHAVSQCSTLVTEQVRVASQFAAQFSDKREEMKEVSACERGVIFSDIMSG